MRHPLQGLRIAALSCALLLSGLVVAAPAAADLIGYTANRGDDTVTPVDLSTGVAGTAIGVGGAPAAVALTPDGNTLLVANSGDGTVTPITIASGAGGTTYTAGSPIAAGSRPDAIAITADGMTAYVADDGGDTVTPITLDGVYMTGTPLTVASGPNAIALTPNGELAYVTSDSGWVTPINTSTNGISKTPPAIRVGSNPDAIAIAPDGATGYVTDSTSGTITRFQIPSDTVETPIDVGSTPNALAITPDGSTAWVANNIASQGDPAQYALTPINLASGTLGGSIVLPAQPSAVVISADGGTAYVTEYGNDEVLPVTLPDGPVGNPITVGADPTALALAPPLSGSGASGGGGGQDPSGYSFPVTGHQSGGAGDQQLTLSTSGTTTSPTAECLLARGTLSARLTARRLEHGRKLRFVRAVFTLGHHSKRVKRLPATVRLPLTGLAAGTRQVVVRVTYRERLRRRTRKLVKTLRTRVKIC